MTNTTQRNAKPENKCNPKTGWLMPSKNVLKGENAAATVAEPKDTATAISFGSCSLRVKAQNKGMNAMISSDME